MSKYDDIIGYLHFHDKDMPYMEMQARAAQFMPFKSLNEYVDYIGKKEDEIHDADDEHYKIVPIDE